MTNENLKNSSKNPLANLENTLTKLSQPITQKLDPLN